MAKHDGHHLAAVELLDRLAEAGARASQNAAASRPSSEASIIFSPPEIRDSGSDRRPSVIHLDNQSVISAHRTGCDQRTSLSDSLTLSAGSLHGHSVVNGYFCANSCDAAKAKKGADPHPSNDPAAWTETTIPSRRQSGCRFGGSLSNTLQTYAVGQPAARNQMIQRYAAHRTCGRYPRMTLRLA